jgi:endonuclease YncB( thermonuclease family)
VRLLQIDAPEPGSGECYSRAAARDLRSLLPAGSAIVLERDPRLDDRDAYDRLLRYVWRGGVNVNVRLVRDGSATVWLFRGERGKYASRLLAEARAARAAKRGLWGACPQTVWNPYGPAVTGGGSSSDSRSSGASPIQPIAGGQCDPSLSGRVHPLPTPRPRLQGCALELEPK